MLLNLIEAYLVQHFFSQNILFFQVARKEVDKYFVKQNVLGRFVKWAEKRE